MTDVAEKMTIAALAAEIMERADDIQHATDLMEREVSRDRELFDELMQPLVRMACYDALRKVAQRERRHVWTAPNYTPAGNGGRVMTAVLNLLDFKLPHNLMPLRDANKDELVEGANWYAQRAGDMAHKSRWLTAIAAKVGSKTVGEKFTADALAKIQEATK